MYSNLLSQRVSSLDCFMKSNPSRHHQDLIRVRLPDNLGLADSEDLVIGIDHRGGGPAHTEETDLEEERNARYSISKTATDPFSVGCQLSGSLCSHGIAGVEESAAGQRPEHGDVLQRHLAGAVLADGDAAVTADHVEVCLGDDAHPQVVEAAGQKGRKSGGEGDCSVPAGHSDADTEHVLLADEALDVAVLVDLQQLLGEGGVLHVPVQRHHAGVRRGQLVQRRAIRLSSGQLLTDSVAAILVCFMVMNNEIFFKKDQIFF